MALIFISHAAYDNQILAVNEPVSAYMAKTENNLDTEQDGACKRLENMKSRQIKVASSIHVRQTAGYGGPLYYLERSKISMEGKWLEKAGFFTGNRIQVVYQENSICMYPAV